MDRFSFWARAVEESLGPSKAEKAKRTKRRLIRELVKDNINTIQGRRARVPRSTSFILRVSARGPLWVVVSLSLLASFYVLSTVAHDRRSATPIISHALRAVATAPSLPANTPLSAERTLPAPQPIDRTALPLVVEKIVLDPGHGGVDVGTLAPLGLVEKDVTLDIGLRLRRLLVQASFEVAMTRETDRTVALKDRARFANVVGGDLFVSIHINWIKTRKTRGIETYYLGPTDDAFVTKLTAMENSKSGYSLGDFRRLLEGIYMDVRTDESRRLAWSVQMELFRSLHKITPQLRNRGVKTAPFVVLVGTEMPAILAEVSCLSNEKEARLLKTTRYRQRIAQALFKAIYAYAHSLSQSYEQGA
ncbi:MAG: N-acetylmuramoyl-L-alanine amidase [Candidatus Methylomirabilales bacterium]